MRKSKNDYIYEGATLIGVGFLLMLILFGAFGASGKSVTDFFVGIFGYASYAYAIVLVILGVLRLFRIKPKVTKLKLAGLILMVLSIVLIAQVASSAEHMGSYGAYLTGCYKTANTIGGALFGLIAFPLMAINYYFALVMFILLFIASTIMAFFVEINAKAIYRSIVRKSNRNNDVGIVPDTDEIDRADAMLNNGSVITGRSIADTQDDYVPLEEMDKVKVKVNTPIETDVFVAPESDLNENFGGVKILTERERAERLLYGDKGSVVHDIPRAEEPSAVKPSAVELLYGKAEIEKKQELDPKEFELYTNGARKRIMEENRAKQIAELRARANGELPPENKTRLTSNINTAYTKSNPDNREENINTVTANNTNIAFQTNGNNAYSSGISGSAEVSNEHNSTHAVSDAHIQNNNYGVDRDASTFAKSDSYESQAIQSAAQRMVESKLIAENNETESDKEKLNAYKEYLLKKRKERSDKGGEHKTSQFGYGVDADMSAVNNVDSTYIPATVRNNAPKERVQTESSVDTGAKAVDIGKVEGVGGFVGNIGNSANSAYSRHNIEDDKPKAEIIKPNLRPYKAPPIALLRNYNAAPSEAEDFNEKIEVLERTLASFNINAKVVNVITGPAFSRLELQMPAGISVNKISAYTNDIAMCLEAKSVRCQIPIPGKNLFGVEIPNKTRGTVGFKSIISGPEFNNTKHALSFAIGQDCDGKTYVVDLNKMPHLLIAGATGSGKSVCINTLICSLLFKYTPEQVKIALVDPKQVELSTFNGLPHLLLNKVICDNDKVINLLDWGIDEMERRYTLMSETRVKNISQYNEAAESTGYDKLPYLVFVVDEVADIVLNLKKEFEDRIMKLAQKARAAGIILVLATQRPSVDVITGSIKANLPSRIACTVTSYVDSKTIIDQGGAEKLLGNGDMLFSESTSPDIVRLQGAYIDAAEVNAVCDFIRENNDTWFDPEIEERIMKKAPKDDEVDALGNGVGGADIDLSFIKAVQAVAESQTASASRLQRVLGLGFPKAAKYIDMMESMGYVGKQTNGNKGRDVYITMEKFLELYGDIELW